MRLKDLKLSLDPHRESLSEINLWLVKPLKLLTNAIRYELDFEHGDPDGRFRRELIVDREDQEDNINSIMCQIDDYAEEISEALTRMQALMYDEPSPQTEEVELKKQGSKEGVRKGKEI